MSVVIPTFQRRASVLEALRSVLAQSRGDFEAIVVDDGSSDGTAAAVAMLDSRVRCVRRRRNGGPAVARNSGILEARAPVVAFLDSDNRWKPGHLAELLGLLDAHPNGVLACAQVAGLRGDALDRPGGLVDGSLDALLGGYLLTSAVAVRREALEAAGGFDEVLRVAEDTDLWCRLSLDGPFALSVRQTVVLGSHPASLREQGRLAGLYPASYERVAARFVARVQETAARRSVAQTQRLTDAGRGWGYAARAMAALVDGETDTAEAELQRACALFPELITRPDHLVRRLGRSHPHWHHPDARQQALTDLARAWPAA